MRDACLALAQQALGPMMINPVAAGNRNKFNPVTLDCDKESFLVALAKLCIAGKAALSQAGHAEAIDIAPLSFMSDRPGDIDPVDLETSWLASPVAQHGPMMALARSMTQTEFENLENPANKMSPSISIAMSLLTEPQVQVTAMSPFAEIIEAVDENGVSMQPKGPYQLQWVEHPAGMYLDFIGVLEIHSPVGHKLAHLRGRCMSASSARSSRSKSPASTKSRPSRPSTSPATNAKSSPPKKPVKASGTSPSRSHAAIKTPRTGKPSTIALKAAQATASWTHRASRSNFGAISPSETMR